MRKKLPLLTVLLIALAAVLAAPGGSFAAAKISAAEYKAGDTVTIEGTIEPGQDLYIAVAQQKMFAVKDTDGVNETKRLEKDMKKNKFNADTAIPPLYYLLTTNPDAFGKEGKKRFGGPSVLLGKGRGIYSTTMFYLNKKFADVASAAKAMLGPVQTEEQWNFLRYANESSYGIGTIVKEGSNVGKVTIFSRTVLTDHGTSGKYWDKGTAINLDKKTGKFTASFKSFRHTPPDTQFDVYVNGAKSGSYTSAEKRILAVQSLSLHEPPVDHHRCDSRGHLLFHDRGRRRHAHGRLPGAGRPNRRSCGHQRRQRAETLQHGPDPVLTPGFILSLRGRKRDGSPGRWASPLGSAFSSGPSGWVNMSRPTCP